MIQNDTKSHMIHIIHKMCPKCFFSSSSDGYRLLGSKSYKKPKNVDSKLHNKIIESSCTEAITA